MRILVVSDVHLGSPSRFPEADKKLIQLLNSQPWDQIILLGDIFDLWIMSYEDILRHHRGVMLILEQLRNAVYIPGNHDSEFRGLRQLNNITVEGQIYRIEDNGVSIGFIHGDQYDPAESFNPIPKIVVWIGAIIDKIAQLLLGRGVSIQRRVRRSTAQMKSVQKIAEAAARQAVKDVGTDIVIVGHFHVPRGPERIGKSLYINSGDFGPDHMTWVVLEDGVPRVSWEGDGT